MESKFWGTVEAMETLFWDRVLAGDSCELRFENGGKKVPNRHGHRTDSLPFNELESHQLQPWHGQVLQSEVQDFCVELP